MSNFLGSPTKGSSTKGSPTKGSPMQRVFAPPAAPSRGRANKEKKIQSLLDLITSLSNNDFLTNCQPNRQIYQEYLSEFHTKLLNNDLQKIERDNADVSIIYKDKSGVKNPKLYKISSWSKISHELDAYDKLERTANVHKYKHTPQRYAGVLLPKSDETGDFLFGLLIISFNTRLKSSLLHNVQENNGTYDNFTNNALQFLTDNDIDTHSNFETSDIDGNLYKLGNDINSFFWIDFEKDANVNISYNHLQPIQLETRNSDNSVKKRGILNLSPLQYKQSSLFGSYDEDTPPRKQTNSNLFDSDDENTPPGEQTNSNLFGSDSDDDDYKISARLKFGGKKHKTNKKYKVSKKRKTSKKRKESKHRKHSKSLKKTNKTRRNTRKNK